MTNIPPVLPDEIRDIACEGGYLGLLEDFLSDFSRRHHRILTGKSVVFEGISEDGNLNIRTQLAYRYTPVTIRIKNQGQTSNVSGYPVSDCTGIVVGLHAGNLHDGGNSYADILDCQGPDLEGVQTYDLIERARGTYRGGRWICLRLRSMQDFQMLFGSNQIRNVA